MEKNRPSLLITLILLFLSGMLFAACGGGPESAANIPENTYPIDPVFLEFYNQYGGAEFFGYPITSVYTTEQGKRGQYFETVLMFYDPSLDEVYFEPLGAELGLGRLPISTWNGPTTDGIVVGKYFILPAFATVYLQLDEEFVGAPLTDPFVNLSKNRVEQHFENMGFYYYLDDPEQTVKLLHYGRLHCPGCNNQVLDNPAVVAQLPNDNFFYNQMELNDIDISITGEVIDGPVFRQDGSTDMIFDFMVLYEQDGILKIRDLPVMLDLADEFLYSPTDRNGLVFREIGDGVGHNVLYLFDDFIKANGGYAVSGEPITELLVINAETKELRQCFEHFCLDYNPNVISQQIRPTPLGEYYWEQFYQAQEDTHKSSDEDGRNQGEESIKPRSDTPFVLLAWENHTVVDSTTPQTVFVMVTLQQTPQPGMNLEMKVQYPNGAEETIPLPQTDEQGISSHTLNPIAGDNGDLVNYEICLTYQNLPPVCVDQIFMIWGNP